MKIAAACFALPRIPRPRSEFAWTESFWHCAPPEKSIEPYGKAERESVGSFVGQTPRSARDALVSQPDQRCQHLGRSRQADGGVVRGPGGPPHKARKASCTRVEHTLSSVDPEARP